MKKYILWIAMITASTLIFSACCEKEGNDPAPYCSEEGLITGIDFRECACCGGWFIEIEGDTLRATDLPQEFKDDLDPAEFPLPVLLEWLPDENPCLGDEIIVECIRREE